MAPKASAFSMVRRSRATPTTRLAPGRRPRARPMDPPSRPSPTTATAAGATSGHRRRQFAPQGPGHGAYFPHQLVELFGLQRLLPVGHRVLRVRVHLDHEAVRAGRHGRAGHGRHVPPLPRPVGRIHDDGQVAQLFDDGHRVEVQRVSGGRFKGADAPLAQDDVGIAGADDVFRGHQPLFDGRGQAPLQQHRLAGPPRLFPVPWEGSTMMGRWLSSLTTGTALRSSVFLVAVSKVRMPRSHKTTLGLPALMMYSAAISHSSMVADRPRFSSTGLPDRPASFSSGKFCMLRAPICSMSAYSATSSTSSVSITSVTTGRPVSARATASSRRPS